MKSKIKNLSKPTLSILLVLLMVLSSVTIGLVATNAAYAPYSTGDGTDTIYFLVKRDWEIKGYQYSLWVDQGEYGDSNHAYEQSTVTDTGETADGFRVYSASVSRYADNGSLYGLYLKALDSNGTKKDEITLINNWTTYGTYSGKMNFKAENSSWGWGNKQYDDAYYLCGWNRDGDSTNNDHKTTGGWKMDRNSSIYTYEYTTNGLDQYFNIYAKRSNEGQYISCSQNGGAKNTVAADGQGTYDGNKWKISASDAPKGSKIKVYYDTKSNKMYWDITSSTTPTESTAPTTAPPSGVWPPSDVGTIGTQTYDNVIYAISNGQNAITSGSTHAKSITTSGAYWVDFTDLISSIGKNQLYFGISSTTSYTGFYANSVTVNLTNAPGVTRGKGTSQDGKNFVELSGINSNITHLGALITKSGSNDFTYKIYSTLESSVHEFDGYYLAGRFATATDTANIHSNTTGRSGVEIYGKTLDDGAGIDKIAGANYWSFSSNSTNIPLTLSSGTTEGERVYKLETHRTVKQLSETKERLLSEYGGASDYGHDPFFFVIHDQNYTFGGSSSNGSNFHQQKEESNALTMTNLTGVTLSNTNELLFNNYNDQSNGQVVIWFAENGYKPTTGVGTPKIWYTIVDETNPAATVARISASPANVPSGSKVTLKGSYAGTLNAPADSITYTFYRSTNGTSWTKIRDAATDATCEYTESAASGTVYYKVVVGSNTTYDSGKNYDTRSAQTSATVYTPGLYMSYHIADTNSVTWSDNEKAYAGYTYPYKRTTGSLYTNTNPYIFTLSSTGTWDFDFEEYEIDEDACQFATITTSYADVTVDEVDRAVRTYVVRPNAKCTNPTIYVDFKNKKIWAVATFSGATKTNTSASGEKVTYYFAERVGNESKSNPNGVSYSNNEGMRIHYWNNSNPNGLNGDANITAKFIPNGKSNNTIYVDTSALWQDNTGNLSGKQQFKVYSVELPIWATSFQFRTGDNNTFDAVPTSTKEDYIANHSITLNPNRIYLLFNSNSTASTDSNWRVKGVILDESMWDNSRATAANEVKTHNVDTNLINFTDNERLENPYKPNGALSNLYSSRKTPHALYFGYFSTTNKAIDTGIGSADNDYYDWGTKFYGFDGTNKAEWAKNLAQRQNDNAFYASVQDFVGMTTSKTQFNTNGDGKTFGYLLDTKGNGTSNNSSLGRSTADPHPVFDYTELPKTKYNVTGTDAHSITSLVKQGLKFPFYESSINGITTYSYDSTTDRNREYSATTNNFKVSDSYAVGADSDGKKYTGLFPFGGNTDNYSNCGFGIEFDMNFYMTNTGYLTDANNKPQDIAFNFSGDDDVWVYVDGVKVLDLGGDHKISAGTINFTDGKVYYKSSAQTVGSVSSVKDSWASDNNNYINTVDLKELLAAYGKTFDSTDATTRHTFQMFYLERGAFQSNCVISFNLPQASGLNVQNKVTADNVNKALQKDALYAAVPDFFNYIVESKLVGGALNSDLTSHYTGLKTPATTYDYSESLDFTTPKYPYDHKTTRTYNDGENSLISYILSTSGGTPQPGASLSYGTSWQKVTNTVYTLSESGNAKLVAEDANYSAVTGKSDANGVFHLLGGEKGTFDNKVPMNSYVKVTQKQALGEVQTNGDNAISYSSVDNNNVGNYYLTSYSIYDEKLKDYIVKKTSFAQKFGDDDDYVAVDSRNGEDNGFYFSNYTGNDEETNSAMTVEFINDIAVGKIRIEKELADNATSNANFNFKVKLGRIFGTGADTLKEYLGLEYYVYNADGTKVYETAQPYGKSGIVLKAGQYAEIEGIPVETRFEVEEVKTAGYTFEKLVKTAVKTNGKDITTGKDSYKYEETVNAPSDSKTTSKVLYTEGEGDDAFKYYVNMIPPVSETYVSEAEGYISTSKVEFTNKPETFTVTFRYYDRDITNNQPAAISSSVSEFSYNITNLDDYIVYKGTNDDAFNSLPKYADVADGEFVAYNYEAMIKDMAVSFASDTGVFGVENLIDNYKLWTTQAKAVAGITDKTNLKTGEKYSGDNMQYHTNRDGQPNTSGDKWVNYLTSGGQARDPETHSENAFYAGDLSNYEQIKQIVVWLYNEPKQYTVNVYGAASVDELDTAKTITLAGSGITISDARVAKKTTGTKFTEVKAYYSQRLGDLKKDSSLNDIAYMKAYGIDACVKQNNDYVCPEEKAPVTLGGLKFAYWAYDPEGTQVASTEWIYGYRVTGDFDLYAVYAPARMSDNQYGLTIRQDADDSYVDKSGNTIIRINTMFNPYNIKDYTVDTTNIMDAAVINIYVTNLLDKGYTDEEIKKLHEKYKDTLIDYLKAKSFAKLIIGANDTYFNNDTKIELTTKGYVFVTNGTSTTDAATLTNKNRLQITNQFKKSQIYVAPSTNYPEGRTVGILQIGAMAYDKNSNKTVDSDEWLLSDNSILRKYSTKNT